MSSTPGEMCKSEISAMNRGEQCWGRGHQRPAFVEPLEEIRRHIAASSSIAAIRTPLTAETASLPVYHCTRVLKQSSDSVHLRNSYFASKMVWVCFFLNFAIPFLIYQESQGKQHYCLNVSFLWYLFKNCLDRRENVYIYILNT